jgi:inositol phosphorylceramide mannosyltransferase catalytic subunit
MTTNNGYKIPNIIHQTFYTKVLPIEIVNIIKLNKSICPGCKFVFYDDNDCDIFIKKNFDSKIYNAFKNINDCYGAMKADFFRYCVLYKIGGIYLDIKSSIHCPIFSIIQPDDICLLDIPRNYMEPWRTNNPTYEQWLLIFAPGHPYLYSMIELMVQYIEIKYQPTIPNIRIPNSKQKILHVTGPDAFTKAVNTVITRRNATLHRNIDYNKYFSIKTTNYSKMYTGGKKHYSSYSLPLYK